MRESFGQEKVGNRSLENMRVVLGKATEAIRKVAERASSVSEDVRDNLAERLFALSHLTEYATVVASRIAARKEFLTQKQQEEIRTGCRSLEARLGIKNEEERIAEAALLIDPPFLRVAALRGDTYPEEAFGIRVWEGWLEARNEIRGMESLVLDDVIKLQGMLARGMSQETRGVLRYSDVAGSDTTDLGKPLTLDEGELAAIENNPILRFMKRGEDPNVGYILYPTVKDPELFAACRQKLSQEANERLDANPTDQMLVMELLDARLEELRSEELPTSREEVIARAAKLQQDIVSIHPFIDSNGRLSRLLMNWYLEKHGVSPSILEHGEEDLFFSEEEWIGEVKRGMGQHEVLKKEPLWESSQKSFYSQVYAQEHVGPTPDPKKMRHKQHREFLVDFEHEHKKFIEATTATFSIYSPNGEMSGETLETKAGGIVPEEYIELFGDTRPGVQEKVRSKFYYNDRFVYRGLPMFGQSDPHAALSLFTQINAATASYRADLYGETSTDAFAPIPREAVQHALQDYNKSVVVDYVRKFGDTPNMESVSPILKQFESQETALRERMPLSSGRKDEIEAAFNRNGYTAHLLEIHVRGSSLSNLLLSPFTSTSTDYNTARTFSRKDTSGLGVLIKSYVPKDGIYYSSRAKDVPLIRGGDIPELGEREVVVPGATDPNSITMVEVLGEQGRIVATISRMPGNQIMFTDVKNGVREVYVFNEDGGLGLASTQEISEEAA